MQNTLHPIFKLLYWLGLFFAGHVLAVLIWKISLPESYSAMTIIREGFNDMATYKNQLFSLQFITHLTTFLLVAIYFITFVERQNINTYLGLTVKPKPIFYVLTLGLLFSCQPLVMLLVEAFRQMPLPADWHTYIRTSNETAKATTEALLQFETPMQFVMGFLMVGVFAGVGEEITFRGIIQKIFGEWLKNPHWAIFFSALLFAIMHGVSYNFLGIWFIGMLLGYIYHFTGNLTFNILFHFLNNAIQVVSLYLFQLGVIEEDYSAKEYFSIPLSLLALALSGFILYLFYKHKNPKFDQYQFISFKNNSN